jgi:hypothetical protein
MPRLGDGDAPCDAFPNEVCYGRAMIRRIDAWIGTRLFHPPIIWLCQRTGMTQFGVARYGWMLAAWTLVMRIGFEGVGDWIFSALVLVVTVIETWRAAVMPNAPSRRSDGLRLIILLFAAFDVGTLIFLSARYGFPGFQWSHAWDLFALTAEYAKTIRTIPPRKRKEAGEARSAAQNLAPRLERLSAGRW